MKKPVLRRKRIKSLFLKNFRKLGKIFSILQKRKKEKFMNLMKKITKNVNNWTFFLIIFRVPVSFHNPRFFKSEKNLFEKFPPHHIVRSSPHFGIARNAKGIDFLRGCNSVFFQNYRAEFFQLGFNRNYKLVANQSVERSSHYFRTSDFRLAKKIQNCQ